MRWLQPTATLILSAPALRIGADALRGQLGADPIANALHRLGFWALFWLLTTLACSPAQRLGLRGALKLRRLVGLFSFGYAVLHFTLYLALDQGFDLGDVYADISKRPFITVGMVTLLLLVPLAITSTSGWVRRLGSRRWQRLHQLIYLAAIGGVVHFIWRVKADLREPLIFAGALALLLFVRIFDSISSRGGRARSSPRGNS